ncbi:EscU/YscU/HrcU family type III secretion system export apparatus switch protein [Thiohalobacter sp. IOR34]|uniref:EscU/YscU/HrcU family type III secretion system export apparatus switch protein n=1 Tax=Thiohalobacter sp. IOR34 TaxID=3057176 RepID=UPI0025B13BB5|nr:EscU/YscU/HrcU family type III secretion system export apparatus switch protein [Thiohalobacter sp. IOR34]WJW74549.1 EscU/YscU/HrcU family type III secretion system export apparatus switch protein [Thiohalobacter sp. IOR34]
MSGQNDNPSPAQIELAIALQYSGEGAPRVTARGQGALAERIIELAREHDIPLQENPPLVQALAHLEPGEEIPPALYLAVAEILAFAYHLSGRAPGTVED